MIYLKYSSSVLALKELRWTSRKQTTAITGETLRGNLFEKRTYGRRIYDIVISSDEIRNQTDLDHLEEYFEATDKQLSFDGTNYINVVMAPGDFPVEFIDSIRALPEVTFTLRRKDPTTSRATGEELI